MEANADEIWSPCLKYLREIVGKQAYYTWLNPTHGIRADNGTLVVGTPNRFVADWLAEHLSETIREALRATTGRAWELSIEVDGDGSRPDTSIVTEGGAAVSMETTVRDAPAPDADHAPLALGVESPWRALLNPRYNFDSFVVGESNQFAHAAAQAVGESPGVTNFNPLYIYGGTGLGKTHLAQAIGQFILDTNPRARVLYATSEQFTNDFINSLSNSTVADFTNTYRMLDCLLLDDIQFFTGKESTQVQFFHTFNALHQSGKQIVLTSDRPPREIRGLEDRLTSRIQWGLVTDVQPPDFETRMAILKKKLESEDVRIPDDVLSYIAQRVLTNIRELEGALIRLLAINSLNGVAVTLDLAQEVLKDQLSPSRRPISIKTIIKKTAAMFEVAPELLISKRKTAEVALARQVAMYLARTLTTLSLKAIGAEFGGRDHSTVIHSVNLVRDAIKRDAHLKYRTDTLINELYRGPDSQDTRA